MILITFKLVSQCQSCINGRCILPLVGQSAYCKCKNKASLSDK